MGIVKPEDQEPSTDGLGFYFDAFRELATTRQIGMGEGPIPFTAILEYFTIYDIEGDFFEFSEIIRRMDNVYLRLSSDEMKKKNEKVKDKGKSTSATTNTNARSNNQG